MEGNTVSRVSTLSEASIEELLAEVFNPFVRVLLESGVPAKVLLSGIEHALEFAARVDSKAQSIHLGKKQRVCMELMCLWRRHPRFLGENGLPTDLPTAGQRGSFADLCEMVGGDESPAELLETLVSFGAVEVQDDGRVSAVTPTFLLGSPARAGRMATDGVLKQLAGFLRVVEHNVSQSRNGRKRRFERSCTVVVAEEYLPIFERAVRAKGQLFIDVLDEWLERHRDRASPSGRYVEVGAGAYFVDLGIVKKN